MFLFLSFSTVQFCPDFITSDTSSATSNVDSCAITACPNDVLLATGLDVNHAKCVGDQFLRLYSDSNIEVAQNDDYCGPEYCGGSCSQISYIIPPSQPCQTYYLVEGCFGESACSGTIAVSVTPKTSESTISQALDKQNTISTQQGAVSRDPVTTLAVNKPPTRLPTVKPSRAPTRAPVRTSAPTAPTHLPTSAPTSPARIKCSTQYGNNICVSLINDVPYCFGNSWGCSWGSCSSDSDCQQYTIRSASYTNPPAQQCRQYLQNGAYTSSWPVQACLLNYTSSVTGATVPVPTPAPTAVINTGFYANVNYVDDQCQQPYQLVLAIQAGRVHLSKPLDLLHVLQL